MKFSIIVPCYNQGEYLTEALQSVLVQTFQNWECIIVNDGSTDDSEEIALEFTRIDSRFKYLKKENGGLSSARNYGLLKSSGTHILPLDADDIINSMYLERALELFSANDQIDLVYGRAEYFGLKTGEWELPTYSYKKILLGNQIYCSCIYKKSFLKNGMYDVKMKNGYEDWEFLVRNLDAKSNIRKLDTVVFYYRIKKESMWTNMNDNKRLESSIIQYIFEKNFTKYIQSYGIIYALKTYFKYILKNNFYGFFKLMRLIK